MNKLFTKIAGLSLGLAMAIGVGVAVGSKEVAKVDAAEEVFYELSPAAGTNNSYTGNCDVKCDGITWNVNGNAQMVPWRLGGKSISNTNRTVYSKTSIGAVITKIELTTGTASSCTVNSIKLEVGNSGFSSITDTVTQSSGLVNTTLTYSPNSGKTWASGSYYRFTFNVTVSGSNNKFIQFVGAKFYCNASTPITAINLSGTGVSGSNPNYTYNIASTSDTNQKTVTVGLNPTTASDQVVKVEHYSGTTGLLTFDSSVTCSSGSGSFHFAGKGTAGTEKFKLYGNTETSILCYLEVSVGTYYTVTFNSDGGTPAPAAQSVESGEAFTFPSPGTKTHYSFLGWSSDGGTTKYATGATSPAVTAAITYTAYWQEDAKYTVTYSAGTNGSGTYAHTNQYGGTYTLLAFANVTGVSADEGYQFKNYTVGGVDKNPGETFTLSAATTITVNFEEKPISATYNFATNFSTYAKDWSGYGTHEGLDGVSDIGGEYAATIDLYYASKQSGTITDKPVFASKTGSGSYTQVLKFTLDEANYKIKEVVVTFAQWTTKTPSVALYKGTAASGTPIDTATIGTKNTLSTSDLNGTVFSIGYSDGSTSSNVQSGLSSIYITLARLSSFGTLDHISITSTPNNVYHVGESYNSTGLIVTAYDGAEEATANFKDVTNDVVTDLDGTYTFVDSDVPGFDCDVTYSGDGGSDTTSFHVYVYALAEYELVTSAPADWSGQYLIVSTKDTTNLAMNGGLSAIDTEGNHKTVSPDANDVIEDGQELEWTIAPYSTGYSIQGKSGKYIGWASGSGNGLSVSDTALVNTLSISGEDVTIAGSGGRHLALNTDGNGRFRYYTSGTVKLYRLKTSDNADAFAQLFLGAFTCDNSGINKPTFAWKEEGVTRWSWSLLITEYNTLTSVEKEQFRLGVASETGTNIEKAIARYDYIVGKYFKTGIDTSFTDFMNRNPAAIGSSRIMLATVTKNSGTTIAIVVISAVSLAAIGGYFLFRKKKEN